MSARLARRGFLRAPEVLLSTVVFAVFTLCPPVHALDLWLEAAFFDATAGSWLFPPGERDAAFWLLYRGPKLFFAAAGIASVLWLSSRAIAKQWRPFETRFLLGLLVFGATPLFVGLLKGSTGVSCPVQEAAFAGPYAHVAIWDRLAGFVPFNEHLRCWPAGHASGGFGLLGLRLLSPPGERLRSRHLLPGLGAGWALGLYQMARGQHYFSHTIVTMVIAILLSSLACAILDRIEDRG